MFAHFLHFQHIVKSQISRATRKIFPFCPLSFSYILEVRPLTEKSGLRHCTGPHHPRRVQHKNSRIRRNSSSKNSFSAKSRLLPSLNSSSYNLLSLMTCTMCGLVEITESLDKLSVSDGHFL